DIDIECEFMVVSSYGASTSTSGHVTISKDLTVNIENRDIIIVEDIIDSGTTLDFIKKLFKSRKANSIEICSLLSKPSRRKIDIDVKYIGFEIPDLFVIGYGLDFDEKYRSLKDIGILKPEAYNGKI
ncbi:MAG: phosphoribosyltransferase family protein, partial [Clostridia bacterium]